MAPASGSRARRWRSRGNSGSKEGTSSSWRAGCPYEEIDGYLAEADASVCLGYENLESRFAFRTRYVDVFRARLPLLCTRGDVLAERVADGEMGITVPERDVAAVAAGITRLLDDHEFAARCRENQARIAAELSWDEAVRPLAEFCRSGDSWAMPAARRRLHAYGRGAMYLAMKTLCQSPPVRG